MGYFNNNIQLKKSDYFYSLMSITLYLRLKLLLLQVNK